MDGGQWPLGRQQLYIWCYNCNDHNRLEYILCWYPQKRKYCLLYYFSHHILPLWQRYDLVFIYFDNHISKHECIEHTKFRMHWNAVNFGGDKRSSMMGAGWSVHKCINGIVGRIHAGITVSSIPLYRFTLALSIASLPLSIDSPPLHCFSSSLLVQPPPLYSFTLPLSIDSPSPPSLYFYCFTPLLSLCVLQ